MHRQGAVKAERRNVHHDYGDYGDGEGSAAAAVAVAATTTAVSRETVRLLQRQVDALQAELDELEPVIGAALLVAAAFRLRDEEGLVMALRGLVRSLRRLEERRDDA